MDGQSRLSILDSYDTANEDSISMYYSFSSSSDVDKTLEGEPGIEAGSEENLRTVLKKHGTSSILNEQKLCSSTPSKKIKDRNLAEVASELGVAPLENLAVKNQPGIKDSCQIVINANLNKCDILTVSLEQMHLSNIQTDLVEETANHSNANPENELEGSSQMTCNSDSSDVVSVIEIVDISETSISKDTENCNVLREVSTVANDHCYLSAKLPLKEIIEEKEDVSAIVKVLVPDDEDNKENENVLVKKLPTPNKKIKDNAISVAEKAKNLKNKPENPTVQYKLPLQSKNRRSVAIAINEPDLARNKPSRIAGNGGRRVTIFQSTIPEAALTQVPAAVEVPELKSILKNSRKSLIPVGRSKLPGDRRKTLVASLASKISSPRLNSRKSMAYRTSAARSPVRFKQNYRKSVVGVSLATSHISMKEGAASIAPKGNRKSIKPGTDTTGLKLPIPTISITDADGNNMKPPTNPAGSSTFKSRVAANEKAKKTAHISGADFACNKCTQKFRLQSTLEAHKKSHEGRTQNSQPMCKFCDKKFAFAKALDNHLLEKCTKIPPGEKKKLLASSMDSASQKPSVNHHSTASISDPEEMPPPSSSSIKKKKEMKAHSGVYSTPSKPVMCHPCKKSFPTVLTFAEHTLSHSLNAEKES